MSSSSEPGVPAGVPEVSNGPVDVPEARDGPVDVPEARDGPVGGVAATDGPVGGVAARNAATAAAAVLPRGRLSKRSARGVRESGSAHRTREDAAPVNARRDDAGAAGARETPATRTGRGSRSAGGVRESAIARRTREDAAPANARRDDAGAGSARAGRGARVEPLAASPSTPMSSIAGVGPKTAERLAARGIRVVADALMFLPRRYDDRRAFTRVVDFRTGEHATLAGTVVTSRVRYGGRRTYELQIKEDPAPNAPAFTFSCRFFQFSQKAMEARYPRGQRVIASGPISEWGSMRQMVHPDLELLAPGEPAIPAGLVPIYSDIDGVPTKTLRHLLRDLARAAARALDDPLPEHLRKKLALPALGEAVLRAHDPDPHQPVDTTGDLHRRLIFDELFFIQLALAKKHRDIEAEPGLIHAPKENWRDLARAMFPFELTAAQTRVLDELAADLAAPRPMNRLLQGDVGAGKTAVALIAAAIVARAGRQTALLAPTEILAAQHLQTARRTNLRAALLTGSTRVKERRELLEQLARGELDLVIGTHALLEPDLKFHALGLGIIDEQHRFGVEQRAALRAKTEGPRPDMLVMTATPIPRTLTLALYGDLSISILDELPPGRTPATTRIFDNPRSKEDLYATIERALDEGRQAFVVYPLVETSEKIDLAAATEAVEHLQKRFAPRPVGLLHGRMRPDQKAATMDRFLRGELKLLVSTTVIEVGVDVPNATVMVVEHAERFGLSQIHQLRGRVGRGTHRGQCFLVTGDASAEAKQRLSILAVTNDGFRVAEHDLLTRGPGEILGTRQSGLPELQLADLVRDAHLLERAREAAQEIIAADAELQHDAHASLARELARRFQTAALAPVG